MRRVVAYLRRLWRREQAEYVFVPALPALPPSLEDVVPYRSPQAATFYQYQCNYWEAPYKVEDSLTSWQWLDEHSFSRRYITRKEYSS